tara:strand:- start:10698 stop:11531 length:834 start_codon:yes stop_codon:yes gene_type:complete
MVKLKGRSKSSKSILVNSDLHVGSSTAVCSQEPYVSEIDTVIKPNKLQLELNNAWYDVIDDLHQKPNLLVINGEPMDGANKKQLGQQSWTTNIEDQMRDSEKLINDIPYDELMFVRGSGYHVQVDGTNFEEVMANRMGAMRYKAYGGQGATDYYAFVDINGKMFNFSHHVGFNKWAAYRTTAIARELAGMHFEKDKLHPADVIVRSHVHYFVHVEFVNTHGVSTPAWKFPDAHLFRGGVAGTTPDIGSVEFIIESNGDIIVKKHIAKLDIKPLVRHV